MLISSFIGRYLYYPVITWSHLQCSTLWPSSSYLPVLFWIDSFQETTQNKMVTPGTLLKGKVSFLELVFRDYFYSVRISVQDIKLTLAIGLLIHKWEMSTAAQLLGLQQTAVHLQTFSQVHSFSFVSDPMTVCQPGTVQWARCWVVTS